MAEEKEETTTLTKSEVRAIVQGMLDKIEIPGYEEQIKKLTEELNEARSSLNTANENIKTLTESLNKLITETDSRMKKLEVPKKSFLDQVILPE